jgi:hypothetical protein
MIWLIYRSNIAHYKERVAVETDPQKIATCAVKKKPS